MQPPSLTVFIFHGVIYLRLVGSLPLDVGVVGSRHPIGLWLVSCLLLMFGLCWQLSGRASNGAELGRAEFVLVLLFGCTLRA